MYSHTPYMHQTVVNLANSMLLFLAMPAEPIHQTLIKTLILGRVFSYLYLFKKHNFVQKHLEYQALNKFALKRKLY